MRLTEEQKSIIKATAPILKENGKEITSIFYKHMLRENPDFLNLFNHTNQRNGTQPLALANTIYFAAENIDHLELLMPQILSIAHKHRALTIKPEHYPIVGKNLLFAIDEFLGATGDTSIIKAWGAAYDIIASIFIKIEKELYDELGDDERNKGFVPLRIIRKEQVANGPIISFTFERQDGEPIQKYQTGQYLTIRIKKGAYFHNRHYSLIEPWNGRTYRIAIKQEIDKEPKGLVSNEVVNNYRVGDQILATLPAGTFCLVNDAKHHLLIAGGNGITVFSAMIRDLDQRGQSNKATLIHCVPSRGYAAFADEMRAILPKNQYHLLTLGKSVLRGLLKKILTHDIHVYLIGSVRFMNRVEEHLAECHHPASLIHLEAFRPSLSIVKNAVRDQSKTKSL